MGIYCFNLFILIICLVKLNLLKEICERFHILLMFQADQYLRVRERH